MPQKIRKDEEFCREAFEQYLRTQLPEETITLVRGEDPPDFRFALAELNYAVEVTSLIANADQVDGGVVSVVGVERMAHRLVKGVEAELKKEDVLRGRYLFHLQDPVDCFSRSKRELRQAIRDFVIDTRDAENVPLAQSVTFAGQSYGLSKHGLGKDVVRLCTSLGGGRQDEIVCEFCSLVRGAVADKTQKMAHLSGPRVLLLLDRFYLCECEDYDLARKAMMVDGGAVFQPFHSVYIIGEGYVYELCRTTRWRE